MIVKRAQALVGKLPVRSLLHSGMKTGDALFDYREVRTPTPIWPCRP